MTDPDPAPPFQTTPLHDGTRFALPRRPLGWLRLLAVFPLAFGAALAVGPLAAAVGFFLKMTTFTSPWRWLLLLVLVPFILGAFRILSFGLGALIGRNDVELRADTVGRVEAVGPLRRARRMGLDEVAGIEVQSAKGVTGGRIDLAALTAKPDDAGDERPFVIAWGYPTAALEQLGKQLTARIAERRGEAPPAGSEAPSTLAPLRVNAPTLNQLAAPEPPDTPDAPPRPGDSTAEVDDRADGVTVTLHPLGVRRGGKGLFGFALLWNGFMAVFTGLFVFTGAASPGKTGGVWQTLGLTAFLSLFWAVGISVFLIALNAGRRRGIIDVVGRGPDATLLITYKGLFRQRQHEWPAGDLRTVKVAPSGTKVNEEDLYNLHIIPRAGKPTKLFTERADDELQWLAGLLRQRLGCGAAAEATPDEDRDTATRRPAGSSVYLDRHADGLTFALPAVGIWKAGKAVLGFAAAWLAMVAGMMAIVITMSSGFWDWVFPVLFLSLFLLVGLGMVAIAINQGRRIGLIDLTGAGDGRKLTVTTRGLFGKRVASWPTSEVDRVRVAPSGTQVNGTDILNLRITTADGEEHGYFDEREDADLRWIAATLRRELDLYPDRQADHPDIA